MRAVTRVILAVVTGGFLMTAIAWSNGNEKYITHKNKEYVSPMEASKPDPDKDYFYETVVIETITPSETFLMFESKFDTLSHGFKSKNKR